MLSALFATRLCAWCQGIVPSRRLVSGRRPGSTWRHLACQMQQRRWRVRARHRDAYSRRRRWCDGVMRSRGGECGSKRSSFQHRAEGSCLCPAGQGGHGGTPPRNPLDVPQEFADASPYQVREELEEEELEELVRRDLLGPGGCRRPRATRRGGTGGIGVERAEQPSGPGAFHSPSACGVT